jgi:hypothetical protein
VLPELCEQHAQRHWPNGKPYGLSFPQGISESLTVQTPHFGRDLDIAVS